MKNISTLFIALFLVAKASAQFETVIAEDGYVDFLRTLKGDYVLVYNSADAGVFDAFGKGLQHIDYQEPVGGYWNAFDLVDTSVVLTGGGFWLDQFGWFGSPIYRKFNSNWMDTWFPTFFESNYEQQEKMLDKGFIEYGYLENWAIRRAPSSEMIWQIGITGLQILDVASNNSLQTLAATNQGLMVVDSTGIVDSIYTNYDFTQIETISFGNLVGTKADSVYLLNNNFEVIEKAIIPGLITKDIKSMEGMVALLTESAHVYLFDGNLLQISDFQLMDDHLNFQNIVPDQNGIILAGTNHYGNGQHGNQTVFIKKYEEDGFDPFADRDAGLGFVQPSSSIEVWEFGDRFKVRFVDTKFQVFNYSDTILNSVVLNVRFPSLPMEYPLNPNPIPQHFVKGYNNLNLQPGESTWLTWDEIVPVFVDYPSGITLDLCFWTSMPDGKSDIDNSNDVACGDFFVESKEIVNAPQFDFELSPNPSIGESFLHFSSLINLDVEIIISNLLGQTIQSHSMKSGNNSLKINNLEKGLYLVSATVGNSIIGTKKLVIQ
ncbi:MAG: T9SS type A sorting domain-containing protein [Saprospiraceae bacterium]|nr:T9SS type A sorting domain-containing protein [Saprospiraceae bacterium]